MTYFPPSKPFKKLTVKEEEKLDFLYKLERTWKENLPNPSLAELLDIYGPEVIPAAKRGLKRQIKGVNDEISYLDVRREEYSNHANTLDFREQQHFIQSYNQLLAWDREPLDRQIKKLQYQLEYLENYGKPKTDNRNDITPERVERAKQYPITDLLDVKRGMTLCIFHDDTKPSMKLYTDNHTYCFSCAHAADAIDICMKLNGIGFREAVRKLAP